MKFWRLQSLISLAVALAAWQVVCALGWVQTEILPPPSAVLHALGSLIASGEMVKDSFTSLWRVIVGFTIGAALGIAFGVLTGLSRWFERYITPLVEAIRPIPPVAFIPLAIMWFGIGNKPAFFLVALGAFFPVFTNAWAGVLSVSPLHRDAALTLGLSRRLVISDVVLPASMPYILAGLQTGLGTAWFCVIVAELVGAQSGLGYMIQLNRLTLQSENVVAGMVSIGVLGYLMNQFMKHVNDALLPWQR